MKKFSVVILLIVTVFLSGCMADEYSFPNKDQPVEKIEMLYNPYFYNRESDEPMELICTLYGKSSDDFLEKLYCLKTNIAISPPPRGNGAYVARVVYQNGDVEMFGSNHIEFIAKGDSLKRIGSYYISKEPFEKLFCEYAGITSFEEDLTRRRGTT